MKRYIKLLLSTILLLSLTFSSVFTVFASQAVEDDFNGETEIVMQGGNKAGVKIISEAEFEKDLSLTAFCSNFLVEEKSGSSTVALKKGETPIVTFNFQYQNESISGSVTFLQGETLNFENVEYMNGNEVQYRIGKESKISLIDGSERLVWIVRVNSFSRSFAVGEEQEKLLSENENSFVKYFASTNTPVVVQALSDNRLYDYPVIQNGVKLIENTLGYERFSFLWDTPTGYTFSGFIVERYANGNYEQSTTFESSSIASLSELRLKQGTKYTYKIYAYDSMDYAYAPCPKVVFVFDDFSVTTNQGNGVIAVFIVIAIVVAIVSVILLYTFWYRLIKRRKTDENVEKTQRV